MLHLFSIWKSISFRRLANLCFSFVHSLFLKAGIPVWFRNKPVTITLEISSVCNLKCPECPSGKGLVRRQNPFMSLDMAKEIIDNHADRALVAILYFQGEPLLNPQWFDIVNYASQKGLFTILSTNGQLLNYANCQKMVHSGLNRLVVSADGIDQAVYDKYRVGGKLDKIVYGLACLRALKQGKERKDHAKGHTERSRSMTSDISPCFNSAQHDMLNDHKCSLCDVEVNILRKQKLPRVVFQTLLTKDTENQRKEIKQQARYWFADKVEFKTMQVYDQSEENLAKWLPSKKRFRRKNTAQRKRKKIVCWRALTNAVYTSDGHLVPCCFDKLAAFSFGHLAEFAWGSERRRNFVTHLARGKVSPAICQNCTTT